MKKQNLLDSLLKLFKPENKDLSDKEKELNDKENKLKQKEKKIIEKKLKQKIKEYNHQNLYKVLK